MSKERESTVGTEMKMAMKEQKIKTPSFPTAPHMPIAPALALVTLQLYRFHHQFAIAYC
jgi:hypothetical protein